ncbi:MAG: TonB-dependent receptor [Gemmatimonadaceae bacterium]
MRISMVLWLRRTAALNLLVLVAAFPAAGQSTGAVAGTVVDSAAAQGVFGARVIIAGTTRATMTDERGQYRLTGLAAGDYTISVSASGRGAVPSKVAHVVGGDTATVDFALTRGSALLSEVVVSATRSPLPAREVAATIHTMSPEQVRTSPARTTDDMLREMPGLELPRTSSTVSGPEEIVSIRGADEGRTLVLLDEVPLNDPWGEWIQWNRAPRFQLERVEVLEGGGSSLYGNYAMGGVISLFTRPLSRPGYNLMASGGSRGEADISAYGSGARGPLAYSVGGDYGTGGGYRTVAPDQRGAIDEASSVTRRNLNGRAEYSLGSGRTVFVTGNYFSDNRSLGTPLTQPNQRQIVSGVLGGNLGAVVGGTLEARVYGQTQKYDSRASTVNGARTAETPIAAQSIPSHDVGGSLEWSRQMGIFQSFAVGGDFRYMTGRLNEDILAPDGSTSGTRSSGGSQEVGGIFVQGVLAPFDPLRIEASARVDEWRSYDGTRITNSLQSSSVASFTPKSNAAFAPRLGVRYAVASSLTLRGSVYQAFRAPTLSEEYRTFFSGPNTFMGNPSLTPEHMTGYDGGFDWQPASSVEVRGTAFLNDYHNLDDFTFKSPGAAPNSAILQRENLGAARSKGIEGEIALRPTEGLTLIASYNYDDARVQSTGKFVNRVPLQRGTARVTYDARGIAEVGAIYRYEGTSHALGGSPLPSFSVVDVDARREVAAGMEIFLSVENLLDHQYTVNFAGPIELIGLPRTIRGGVTLRSF